MSNQLFYRNTTKKVQFLKQLVLKTEMEIHGNDLGSPRAEGTSSGDFDL